MDNKMKRKLSILTGYAINNLVNIYKLNRKCFFIAHNEKS